MMNCKKDNKEILSSTVPHSFQENGTFLVDLEKLQNRKDLFCDDNGAWTMKGNKCKLYNIRKDTHGQVVSLSKGNADIIVRRRPYVYKSCPDFHKTIISIEYGKEIDKWYPIVLIHYYFDGEPKHFTIAPHGSRKATSTKHQPYIRTKESTKEKLVHNLTEGKNNTKRALFKTIKDVGGVIGAESTGALPRNYTQVKNLKRNAGLTRGSSTKSVADPLLAVLELQKSTFPGFIREVVCNDLPTIMLYTDWQIDSITKFCCHKKAGLVSELGIDVTFQLGPFYVVVTTYRNTLREVKGEGHSPSCLGPMMIRMTKEESTYLSFIHCLLRELPGLSKYLHATGTDNEAGLTNAIAAGMHNAHPLLCYLHCERNTKDKMQQLGLSKIVTQKICQDIYGQRSGLIWADSKEEFDTRAAILLEEWDILEASERTGAPKFADYFRKFKLEDMREKMAKFVMKDLGFAPQPYHQNVPESVNRMIKEWTNFVPQDLDQFITSMYDFIESFEVETELAWFGISDKWEVKDDYRKNMPQMPHGSLTSDERKDAMKRVSKVCPDVSSYYQCRKFKFANKPLAVVDPTHTSSGKDVSSKTCKDPGFQAIALLTKHFSEEELRGILEKAKVVLNNRGVREGFKKQPFIVNSGRPLPFTVQIYNSGKCSCTCSFFERNSLCHHVVAVAIQSSKLDKIVTNFPARSLTRLSTSSAPPSVGSKRPPRKRKRSEDIRPSQHSDVSAECTQPFTSEEVNPTTLVIRRNTPPANPIPSAPLIMKRIAGGIRKCSECQKPISSTVGGFSDSDDKEYCFGRFESYNFWNKNTNSYQTTASTRYFHLNPVTFIDFHVPRP